MPLKDGARVRLIGNAERYPHFIAPSGATGTVVDHGDPAITLAVRLDEPLPGAEEWGNEVHWLDGDGDPSGDVSTSPVTYTLVEFHQQAQIDPATGKSWWEEEAIAEDQSLMVFNTPEDAADMARFMLGADGDDGEREPREGMVPLIGILANDCSDPDENTGWAQGWVGLDGVYHDGDYENDPPEWETHAIRPA